MLASTNVMRTMPPSSSRKTVGSTGRSMYVARMNAEVTRMISETKSVSVPTGIKTLNRRIIRAGPVARDVYGKTIILGLGGNPNSLAQRQMHKPVYLDYQATTP